MRNLGGSGKQLTMLSTLLTSQDEMSSLNELVSSKRKDMSVMRPTFHVDISPYVLLA